MVKFDDTSLPHFSLLSLLGSPQKQNISMLNWIGLWRHPVVAAPGLDLEVLGKGSLSQFHR